MKELADVLTLVLLVKVGLGFGVSVLLQELRFRRRAREIDRLLDDIRGLLVSSSSFRKGEEQDR